MSGLRPVRVLVVGIAAWLGTTVAALASVDYQVRLDAALEAMDVAVCFGSSPPKVLLPGRRDATRWLQQAHWDDGTEIAVDARQMKLGPGHGRCLRYRVDLSAAAQRPTPGVALADARAWLWLPPQIAKGRIEFTLPEGYEVSVPWQPIGDGATGYRLDDSPRAWPSRTAFGRLATASVELPGGRLRVAVAMPDADQQLDKLTRWIGANAMAITTLYGRFPLPSTQVLVTASTRASGGPVPWGQVLRGGAPALWLEVNTHYDFHALLDDWTLSHEMSHLLLPFITRRQAWLSEGFASYYQNVLRARAGLLSELEAWRKLDAGFGRGLADTRGRPLSETTRRMRSEGAYMRVYWSGVAIALLADVEIRRATGGRHSLDSALDELQRCCLPSARSWSAKELAARIDAASGTKIFSGLVARYEHATEFPAVRELYPALGIRGQGRAIELHDEAPLADLRRAVMGAKVD